MRLLAQKSEISNQPEPNSAEKTPTTPPIFEKTLYFVLKNCSIFPSVCFIVWLFDWLNDANDGGRALHSWVFSISKSTRKYLTVFSMFNYFSQLKLNRFLWWFCLYLVCVLLCRLAFANRNGFDQFVLNSSQYFSISVRRFHRFWMVAYFWLCKEQQITTTWIIWEIL